MLHYSTKTLILYPKYSYKGAVFGEEIIPLKAIGTVNFQ